MGRVEEEGKITSRISRNEELPNKKKKKGTLPMVWPEPRKRKRKTCARKGVATRTHQLLHEQGDFHQKLQNRHFKKKNSCGSSRRVNEKTPKNEVANMLRRDADGGGAEWRTREIEGGRVKKESSWFKAGRVGQRKRDA